MREFLQEFLPGIHPQVYSIIPPKVHSGDLPRATYGKASKALFYKYLYTSMNPSWNYQEALSKMSPPRIHPKVPFKSSRSPFEISSRKFGKCCRSFLENYSRNSFENSYKSFFYNTFKNHSGVSLDIFPRVYSRIHLEVLTGIPLSILKIKSILFI